VRLCTGPSSATLARRILRDGPPRNDEHTVCQRFEAEGAKGLINKRPGRKPGEQRLLTPAQEAGVQVLIRRHTPDELGLPFALWNRAAVRALIARQCGVELAVRTVGKYLARWGFTAQKPIRRAYEQDPAAVRRWLRQDYPEIVRRAKQARGVVVWGDETGLRADDLRGRSYAPRGRTPVVRVCQTRIKLSLITAVTNKGELRWMIVDGAVNGPTFIRFLQRLIRDARGKVFLIVDRLKAHRARLVRDWLEAHRSEIELHYLPSYSPELNPDEGVNADLKQALPRQEPARSKEQLRRAADRHMRSLSRRPQRIRAIFRHPQFRYAA
jgi:transposase